jgi:sigma-B regulation protein RsbU (phosphoserine phosphatase)
MRLCYHAREAKHGMETHDPVRFLQSEVSRLRDENRGLKEELGILRSSVRTLSGLQDLIHKLSPGMNVIALLDDLLASALAVVGASAGSLMLVDEETGELVFAVVHGQARDRLKGYRLAPGEGIAGWVATNRVPQTVIDVRQDPRFSPMVDETFGFHTRMLTCVPLLDGERVLGVIEAINKTSDREFTDDDSSLLMVVAQLAAVAILRAESFPEPDTAS